MLAFAEFEGQVKRARGSYRWWKLQEAAEFFRAPAPTHRALADVIATKAVYHGMKNAFPLEKALECLKRDDEVPF
jgi:hypothetical protein